MIDINYISKLSELKLTLKEKKEYKKQLEKVISYVNDLNKVKTNHLKPIKSNKTSINKDNDNISNSLDIEEVLKNSHSTYNNLFKVKIILKNKII